MRWAQHVGVNAGLLLGGSMQLLLEERLDGAGTSSGDFAIVAGMNTSALDGQSLVHDRASPGNVLEVGNGTATWRLLGSGRQSSEGCGRRLFEEGTHALGLTEECLHLVGTIQERDRRGKEVQTRGKMGVGE
jgi:hypothetical protein